MMIWPPAYALTKTLPKIELDFDNPSLGKCQIHSAELPADIEIGDDVRVTFTGQVAKIENELIGTTPMHLQIDVTEPRRRSRWWHQ